MPYALAPITIEACNLQPIRHIPVTRAILSTWRKTKLEFYMNQNSVPRIGRTNSELIESILRWQKTPQGQRHLGSVSQVDHSHIPGWESTPTFRDHLFLRVMGDDSINLSDNQRNRVKQTSSTFLAPIRSDESPKKSYIPSVFRSPSDVICRDPSADRCLQGELPCQSILTKKLGQSDIPLDGPSINPQSPRISFTMSSRSSSPVHSKLQGLHAPLSNERTDRTFSNPPTNNIDSHSKRLFRRSKTLISELPTQMEVEEDNVEMTTLPTLPSPTEEVNPQATASPGSRYTVSNAVNLLKHPISITWLSESQRDHIRCELITEQIGRDLDAVKGEVKRRSCQLEEIDRATRASLSFAREQTNRNFHHVAGRLKGLEEETVNLRQQLCLSEYSRHQLQQRVDTLEKRLMVAERQIAGTASPHELMNYYFSEQRSKIDGYHTVSLGCPLSAKRPL